jgi:hypothetical protein
MQSFFFAQYNAHVFWISTYTHTCKLYIYATNNQQNLSNLNIKKLGSEAPFWLFQNFDKIV